jgi:hypothetical protein
MKNNEINAKMFYNEYKDKCATVTIYRWDEDNEDYIEIEPCEIEDTDIAEEIDLNYKKGWLHMYMYI